MFRLRLLLHLAHADFLERTRRPSFFWTIGMALFLGWAVHAGKLVLKIGDYRGVFNDAWAGALMTTVVMVFLSLVGFYLVKNTIERDRVTRVGEILATTPMTRLQYVAAKALSNFLFLMVMVGVCAAAAVLLVFLHAEVPGLRPWALLSPFLLLAVPTMAMIAALALLFETLPWLRTGAGNRMWFFVWLALLALPVTGDSRFDLTGISILARSMHGAVTRTDPAAGGGFSLTAGATPAAHTFRWDGIEWTSALLMSRLQIVLAAIALVLLSSLLFDRFREGVGALVGPRVGPLVQEEKPVERAALNWGTTHTLPPLDSAARHWSLPRMMSCELQLIWRGQSWWWRFLAAMMFAFTWLAPIDWSRGKLLPVVWIYPLMIWSAMGTREPRYNLDEILRSTPRSLSRHYLAVWGSGVVVALLLGSAVIVRLLLARDLPDALAVTIGAFFAPSLALACGAFTGTPRLFEALYTILWYIGPLQPTPALDFMGTTRLAVQARTPFLFLLLTALLIGLAWWRRGAPRNA